MGGSAAPLAPPSTITAALERAAADFEHDEAVVDGATRWTFAQLLDESTRVARALVASGLAPGDRVALWAPNSARWIASSFGVYLAGGVLVPIDTRFEGTEAWHVLRRSGAGLLLASTDTLGTDLVGLLHDEAEHLLPARDRRHGRADAAGHHHVGVLRRSRRRPRAAAGRCGGPGRHRLHLGYHRARRRAPCSPMARACAPMRRGAMPSDCAEVTVTSASIRSSIRRA